MLRGPGSKGRLADWILSLQPIGRIGEYREGMLASGSIALRVGRELPVHTWGNDADGYLIDCWLGLRDRAHELAAKSRRLMPYLPGEPPSPHKNRFIKETFDFFVHNAHVDPALRYFFCNCTTWNGRVNFDRPSRMHCTCPQNWRLSRINRLEAMSREIQHWQITAHDYSVLLDAPGDDVWVVLDPPYWRNTLLHWSAKLYRLNFTEEDHRRLAARVAACRHNVLVCYDDCPEVRELYPRSAGFHHFVKAHRYVGTPQQRVVSELVITNYLPLTLN